MVPQGCGGRLMEQVVAPLLGEERRCLGGGMGAAGGESDLALTGWPPPPPRPPLALRSWLASVGNVPVSFLTLIIPLAQPSVSDGSIKVDLVHEKEQTQSQVAVLGGAARREAPRDPSVSGTTTGFVRPGWRGRNSGWCGPRHSQGGPLVKFHGGPRPGTAGAAPSPGWLAAFIIFRPCNLHISGNNIAI